MGIRESFILDKSEREGMVKWMILEYLGIIKQRNEYNYHKTKYHK